MCSGRVCVVDMALVRGSIVVAMVAVDDVGGHKLVDDSRDDLDANEACGKEAHHDKASSLIGPTLLLKVFFGLGEHAEQRGEEHDAEAQAQRAREEDVAVLDTEVGLARDEAHQGIDADDGRAKDASYAADAAKNPPAGVVVDTPRLQPHGESVSRSLSLRIVSRSAAAATVLYVGCWQVCGVLTDIDDRGCRLVAVFLWLQSTVCALLWASAS